MPGMDGFSFLRVLMGTHPLPVIVVSSDARRDIVLKALELGALDFVAKSAGHSRDFEEVLVQKLRLFRSAKVVRPSLPMLRRIQPAARPSATHRAPRYVVAIAASTGGPAALLELVSNFGGLDQFCFVVVQHMPARFTTSFAERLNRIGTLHVVEARDGDVLSAGKLLLCPGDKCMTVEGLGDGRWFAHLHLPAADDRYVPNASRLLASVGEALKVRSIAMVLTGMGDDGADGAQVVAESGGRVYIESRAHAVIPGMPDAAARAVPTAVECTLAELPKRLLALVSSR
jgi:two-component system chemotaxis response regulator CheB